jgi:hypothetical protein
VTLPEPGSYVIVRTDDLPREAGAIDERQAIDQASENTRLIAEGRVHNFTFSVHRVGASGPVENHVEKNEALVP